MSNPHHLYIEYRYSESMKQEGYDLWLTITPLDEPPVEQTLLGWIPSSHLSSVVADHAADGDQDIFIRPKGMTTYVQAWPLPDTI